MKKLFLLIPICFVLCGCPDMGKSIDYDYSIVNNSEKKITFIPYINGTKDLQNIITLNQGKILNKRYTYTPPGAAGYSMTQLFTNTSGAISHIALVYDNEKNNIFSVYSEQCTTCPNIPNSSYKIIYNKNNRNPFNLIFNDRETEVYIITPEDYENAIDCNGNCY